MDSKLEPDMILPGIDEQTDAQHNSPADHTQSVFFHQFLLGVWLDPADLPHQIEVGFANGKTDCKCKEAEITVQTQYRWRKEYGG